MGVTVWTIPGTPAREAERERAVLRSGALTIADTRDLTAIAARAQARLSADMAIVTVVYQDSVFVVAASGLDTGIYRRSTSFCGHAILEADGPFVVADAAADERFAGNPYVDDPEGVRFYAGVPLVDGDLPIGMLCVMDSVPRPDLTMSERAELVRLAGEVMAQLKVAAPVG